MTKRLPLHVKLQRKPISRACVFCHTKHLQCDSTRPCKNCVKRNVADSCQDVQRKRSKPKSGKPKESKRVKLETSVSQPEQVVNSGSNFDTGRPSVIEQVHQKEAKQESSSSSSGISSPLLNIPNSSTLNMPDNNTLNNQTLDMLNIAEVKGLLDNHLNGLEKDNFGVSDKNKFYIGSPTGLSSRLSVTNLLAAQELFSNESNERNATQQNSQSTNDPLQHLSAIQLDRTASPVDDKSSKKSVQDNKKDNEEESGIINNVETDYNIFNSDFTNNFSIDTQNNNPIQDGNQDGNLSNLFYDGLNNQMIFRPFIKLGKDYNNNNDQSDFSVPSSNEEQINQHHHINNATPNNPDSLSMGPNSSARFGNIHTESPLSNTMYENQFNEHPEEFQQYTQPLNLVADKPPFLQQPHQQYSAQPLHTLHQHPLETQPRLTVNELINNFKRKEAYKSPLLIRKKVFQEVGDIYSKFPVFDLNRLLNGSSNTHGDNPYQDLRYVMGILSFSYMKSYQELIKYFYDRFYLQSVGPYNYDDMTEEEREKTKNSKRKLFFKVLEKIWLLHNYFRIQSALIQTDLTQLTNFSDSLMTELTFHRQLLNFESMINNYTSTPAIIWRRSTEIVFVSDEICALIGIKNKAKFLSKRRYLCEIIDDMSILNYFKLFNNVVLRNKEVSSYHNVHNRFDRLKNRFRSEDVDDLENELSDERINNGSKMLNGGLIRFNCKFINQNYKGSSNTASSSALDTKNHSIENFHAFESTFHKPYSQEINEELEQQQKFISSSSILTIKKDMFDIPMLIVGQFLPILE